MTVEPQAGPNWKSIRLPDSCVNLECRNKLGEGAFTIVEELRTSSGPPIRLFMCSPCAAVMRGDQR